MGTNVSIVKISLGSSLMCLASQRKVQLSLSRPSTGCSVWCLSRALADPGVNIGETLHTHTQPVSVSDSLQPGEGKAILQRRVSQCCLGWPVSVCFAGITLQWFLKRWDAVQLCRPSIDLAMSVLLGGMIVLRRNTNKQDVHRHSAKLLPQRDKFSDAFKDLPKPVGSGRLSVWQGFDFQQWD